MLAQTGTVSTTGLFGTEDNFKEALAEAQKY
jgi:hypothetical protein